MKNKASVVFKQVMAALSSIIKAKSMAAKSKTSAAKTRLLMFSLMKKKVLMSSISHKIHNILGHDKDDDDDDHQNDNDKAMVVYMNEVAPPSRETQYLMEAYADDDKYPDLRHCLFDDEDEQYEDVAGGSVIDIVRNNKEGEGEDFKLEDEIDEVADLFIRRFHKQMRLQKLESFKRYQEMLQRGAA